MLYCLMLTGKTLTDQVRNLLFDTAQEMFADKKEYTELKTHYCEGYVSTKWVTTGFGGIYGVLFESKLSYSRGSTTVSYIVREADFTGDKLTWSNIDEPTFSEN